MTISATLVGGMSPKVVQVVVSTAPNGEAWTLKGVAGSWSWEVASGVGDGAQLTAVDIRSPGNVPVVYTFTSSSVVESTSAIVVPFAGDFVLQTLDGQKALSVDYLEGSLDFELIVNQAIFAVPGRQRPVARHTTTSDGGGTMNLGVETAQTKEFVDLLRSGAPVLYRCGRVISDLDPVDVVSFTGVSSVDYASDDYRVWSLPFLLVPDPYRDQILGAFSWDYVDAVAATKTWDQFKTLFTGKTWNQFDTTDWSVL